MAWICLVPAMLLLLLLKGEASDGKAVSATKESAASNEGDGTLRVKDIRWEWIERKFHVSHFVLPTDT